MSARLAVRLCVGVLLLLCDQAWSHATEPEAAPPPSRVENMPSSRGPATSTLRVRVAGNHLCIVREQHTSVVTLGSLALPAPAREPPLLLGRAAYVLLHGMGVVVVDVGIPEDPYIVWHIAKQRMVSSLSLWQDRLRFEMLAQSFDYDVREPLRPRGREITRGSARRFYAAGSFGHDPDGLPRFAAEAPAGRRLCLKSGEILQGQLHRQGAGRYLLCPDNGTQTARNEARPSTHATTSPQPCEGPIVQLRDIERLDAVYLDEVTPEDAVVPPQSQLGVTSAILRQPDGAQPAGTEALSALLDGSAGPLLYRVQGARFEVRRRTDTDDVPLGVANLPRPARSSALILGSAAYVLLQHGVAVIDITLARYPFVVWVLEPSVEIERMQLQQGTLVLQSPGGVARYNVARPLLPSGPHQHAVNWRRYADGSVTAADASWVERTESGGPAARRLFLRGSAPQLVWDFRCSADSGRCTFRHDGKDASTAVADIEQVEAVHVEAVPAEPVATLPAEAVPAAAPGRKVLHYDKIMIAVGLGVFGATYLPLVVGNSLTGLTGSVNGWYYLPGSPIVSGVELLQKAADPGNRSLVGAGLANAGGVLAILGGVVQVASLTTAIVGVARWANHRKAQGGPVRPVALFPRVSTEDVGVTVLGRF